MRKLLTTAALVMTLGTGLAPMRAEAYAVDCAILLCLAGGWPASAPCAHAKAEFIRRITPWPIEPPLQIWRCPMSAASGDGDPAKRFAAMVAELSGRPVPMARAVDGRAQALRDALMRVPASYDGATPGADADVSGPAFDFIRSIVVYDVDWYEYDHENHEGDHSCRRLRQRVRIGTYDDTGAFSWRDAHVSEAISRAWLGFTTRRKEACSYEGYFRGVAVEWRAHGGTHDHEIIQY
ncbi:hypothetical protein [Jannaschia sp. M317]|uniref:hypothetical protein n=1 Tax=Jannaschia sp. M317 TaxID=2867011 RepID=UPI0021A8B814|nr:hypothetical protein [Jannaschia sp. M317]UWQ19728.1 hypothetical protein K3551_18870 [Jannaschia sp. M317]